jgi:hypothetical protein
MPQRGYLLVVNSIKIWFMPHRGYPFRVGNVAKNDCKIICVYRVAADRQVRGSGVHKKNQGPKAPEKYIHTTLT